MDGKIDFEFIKLQFTFLNIIFNFQMIFYGNFCDLELHNLTEIWT